MKKQEFKPVSCGAELPFRVRGRVCSTLPDDCKSLNTIVQDVWGIGVVTLNYLHRIINNAFYIGECTDTLLYFL